MNDTAELFYIKLLKAVETDQLKLPSLPEVALKVRNAVENASSSAEQIADILCQDPALATRLLQLANSPLYRPRSEITSLQMAVARLGIRVVRDLIMTLAMKQIYQADSDALQDYFRQLWSSSVEVAAISRVIADQTPGLVAEQGLLAGLIHNIGALPVLLLAEREPAMKHDVKTISEISCDIQCRVGKQILQFWHLPGHLVEAVSQWNDLSRDHPGPADYVDVVQAAILLSSHHPCRLEADTETQIPAMHKLDLDPSSLFENTRLQIDETIQALMNA